MVLTASTGTISASALRANLDDHRATLLTQSTAGRKDFTVPMRLAALADTTALSLRTVAFTPQDDVEVRMMFLRVTDTVAGRIVTLTLSVDDGETAYLLDKTISTSVTTINGTVDSRTASSLDLRTVTGDRIRLLKGVRYRLTVENTSAGTTTGEVRVGLQLRTRRRGGTGGIPRMPRALQADGNLDVDALNDSLERARSDIKRNMDRRYTRSFMIYPFDGVTNATGETQRTFYLRPPGTGQGVTIEAVEVVSYGNAARAMTVTSSTATDWPGISVDTVADATTEVYGSSGIPIAVDDDGVDTRIIVAWDGAYTVTRGYLVIHLLSDRGNLGDDFDPYVPDFFDATDTAIGTKLDTELAAIAAAVADDGAADKDLRCECFVARSLAVGADNTYRLPSGARRIHRVEAYIVANIGDQITATASNGITSVAVTVVGVGILVRAVDGANAGADATTDDDPMDSADDVALEILESSAAGTVEFAQVNVWWS
jgi:hypothetical protein